MAEPVDFSKYNLIIDARSAREYGEDHIPGAINLPVVNDEEYAEVGTKHRTDTHDAYMIGVAYSLENMARNIREVIRQYPRETRILVYCFRGGKRSKLWTDNLLTIGYKVDRLPGGWKGYRRSVVAELSELPKKFSYHVLSGPTGCGKTRLLTALRQAGSQVLDLEDIASHRGSLIGAIPGVSQPTQKYFDSILLQIFHGLDPSRPVWVEAESKKIGDVQLPDALFESMHKGKLYAVKAPMSARVKLWREDYRHFEEDPVALLERLQHLIPLVGKKEYEVWDKCAREGQMPELFERLMTAHYDPAYERSIHRNYPQIDSAISIELPDLESDTLNAVALNLARGMYDSHLI